MCEVLPAARRLYALAAGCFGVFFTAAAAVSIGCSRIPFYTVQPAVLAAFGLSAAAVLVLAWQGWRRLWRQGISARTEGLLAGGALVLWWVLQLAQGQLPAGDYFTLFPNNIPLCLVLAGFMRIFGTGMLPALVLNTLAVNLSVLFCWRLLRRQAGPVAGLFGLGVCLCLAPLLLYGPIVYTDTLSMPFVCGGACLWSWAREGSARRRLAGLAAVGAVCALGGWLKVTVAILLIAILLDALLSLPGRQKAAATAAVAVFAVAYSGLSALSASSPLAGDPDAAIPHSHWVMMGLSGDGGYNDDDYQLTLAAAPDKAGRDAFDKAEILARLQAMGPAGLLEHLAHKLSYVWGDGSCYAPMKLDIRPVRSSWLQSYCIQGMAHTGRTVYLATGLQLALLGLAVWGAIQSVRRQNWSISFVQIALLGLGLFLLLWEARSRYIVSFLPLLAVCGVWGLCMEQKKAPGL